MENKPKLRKTKIKAFGFHSKIAVPLLGEFLTTVCFKQHHVLARNIILDGDADDIVGYSTATRLGIVKITCDNNPIDEVDSKLVQNLTNHLIINVLDNSNWIYPFLSHPELFSGKLGLFKNFLVNLQVDPTAKPIQHPAYLVPFGLLEMTKAKLDFLESSGTILKSTNETPTWISPLQPVAKLDAMNKVVGVRITSNAKQLNKKIKRHIP